MKSNLLMVAFILSSFALSSVYADESVSVVEGAEKYDWQACINAKVDDCINDCDKSEDINCGDECNSLAKDKCLSEGFNPPQ